MITAVATSGRQNANSTALLDAAIRGASGIETVTRRELSGISFTGCTGCGSCRKGSPVCVVKDGLTPLLGETAEASGLIIAGPVYYGYVSGIFKSFLDRWYSFKDGERKLRTKAGRPLLCILTQGHPDQAAYERMASELDRVFTGYGFTPRRMIAAGLEAPGMAAKDEALLGQAEELGRAMAASLSAGK